MSVNFSNLNKHRPYAQFRQNRLIRNLNTVSSIIVKGILILWSAKYRRDWLAVLRQGSSSGGTDLPLIEFHERPAKPKSQILKI